MDADTQNVEEPMHSEDLAWLVYARYDAQAAVLLLHEFEQKHMSVIDADPKLMSAFLTLNGVALSLWRAAFLMSADLRSKDDAKRDARQLRLKVLKDNLVTFMVDRTTEKWMGGYYLKNAKYRLDEVKEGLEGFWCQNYQNLADGSRMKMMRRFISISRRPFREPGARGQRWSNLESGLRKGKVILCDDFEKLGPKNINQDLEQTKIWRILNIALQDLLFCLFAVGVSKPDGLKTKEKGEAATTAEGGAR